VATGVDGAGVTGSGMDFSAVSGWGSGGVGAGALVISMRALVTGWATARLFSLVGTAVSVLGILMGILFQVYWVGE